MTIVSRPIKKNKLDKGSQKTSQIFILKDIRWDIISFWKRTNGIFMSREQTNKQNLCVKEISLYINQYSQKRYDKRLYRAENSTQQKKTRNDREGANDMNYMKTWKLNIVWLFISYEQSSIRDCRPNITPAPKYN